ncbi:MAG: PadR family transcriptional regulator [Desulfurococcales archaeon]|nr:PadR family transcriptional regulator [Desulfurococcales archaeon]
MIKRKTLDELRKGLMSLIVLDLLVENGPLHGYWIRIKLGEKLGEAPAESTVYTVLKRLEKQGLIKGYWARGPSGKLRRYYTITEDGRVAHKEILREAKRLLGETICREGD